MYLHRIRLPHLLDLSVSQTERQAKTKQTGNPSPSALWTLPVQRVEEVEEIIQAP